MKKENKNYELITNLINSLENDYSQWGDLSEWTREDTIKTLKKIRRTIEK